MAELTEVCSRLVCAFTICVHEATIQRKKDQRLKPLKFIRRSPSKGENEKSKDAVKDSAKDYLHRAACLNSVDEIVTEVVCAALPAAIQEAEQELDQEEILDGIISCVAENEVKALIQSVLDECHIETVMPQQQQEQQENDRTVWEVPNEVPGSPGSRSSKAKPVHPHQPLSVSSTITDVATFAAEQLIDMFLLEHLIGKMSFQGPRFSGKEHLSVVLDSLMLDILLRQFFSIQQQQQATFENVPLRDFHLKAFTEVALDVILTELNKVMEEDMEDLLEYERNIQ